MGGVSSQVDTSVIRQQSVLCIGEKRAEEKRKVRKLPIIAQMEQIL
jgi:hypothetical protein